MKPFLMTIAVFGTVGALAAFSAAAQGQPTPGAPGKGSGDRVGRRLATMKERLGLTDDQVPQVEALLRERASQAEQDRAAAGSDRQEAMRLARERNRVFEEKLDGVLTPEQKAKHEQLKKERREKARSRMHRRIKDQPPTAPASPKP